MGRYGGPDKVRTYDRFSAPRTLDPGRSPADHFEIGRLVASFVTGGFQEVGETGLSSILVVSLQPIVHVAQTPRSDEATYL
jgi:hypothetical protein